MAERATSSSHKAPAGSFCKFHCISFLFFSSLLSLGAKAQDSIDPAQAYNIAAQAIATEEWDKGLEAVNGMIAAHGESGKDRFGPVFGHFYYLRGLLQIGKKQYEAAIQSFKTCLSESV